MNLKAKNQRSYFLTISASQILILFLNSITLRQVLNRQRVMVLIRPKIMCLPKIMHRTVLSARSGHNLRTGLTSHSLRLYYPEKTKDAS